MQKPKWNTSLSRSCSLLMTTLFVHSKNMLQLLVKSFSTASEWFGSLRSSTIHWSSPFHWWQRAKEHRWFLIHGKRDTQEDLKLHCKSKRMLWSFAKESGEKPIINLLVYRSEYCITLYIHMPHEAAFEQQSFLRRVVKIPLKDKVFHLKVLLLKMPSWSIISSGHDMSKWMFVRRNDHRILKYLFRFKLSCGECDLGGRRNCNKDSMKGSLKK